MASISQLVIWEVLILAVGLFGTVAIQLLTGRINTHGLFYGVRRDGSRFFSPDRIQLLLFTMAFGLQYLMKVIENPSGQFPPIENSWIALVGGSHALYLGRKMYSMVLSKPQRSSDKEKLQ